VYRRILGPVYENEKENWRILTNKEIYASVKKTYCNRDNNVKKITLVWTYTENGRKQNSQKSIIYEFGNNKIERQTKK
jgi:undecaprenyl pyrophosphate synthase